MDHGLGSVTPSLLYLLFIFSLVTKENICDGCCKDILAIDNSLIRNYEGMWQGKRDIGSGNISNKMKENY